MKSWLWHEGWQFIKIIVTGQLPLLFYMWLGMVLLLLFVQLLWLPDKWLSLFSFTLAFPFCYIMAIVIVLISRPIVHVETNTVFWLALVLLCGTLFADTLAKYSLWITFLSVTALVLLAFMIVPIPITAPLYWKVSLATIFASLLCVCHSIGQFLETNTSTTST